MGEYTGRRRGRPASEPEPEPEAQYGYQQPQYDYGYEAPSYEVPSYEAPSYEAPSYEAPSYEAPSYETYGYETAQYVEPEAYAAPGYGYPEQYSEQYAEPYSHQYAEGGQYAEPYSEQYTEQYVESYNGESYNGEYYEEYTEEYYTEPYGEQYGEQYVEEHVDDYAEPRFEPRRRSVPEAEDQYAPDYDQGYDYVPPARPRPRQALPLLSHLPFLGASTAALLIASSVSTKAVAAVVLPLQLLVAWAILDLAGHASRRTAAFVALPTLAATLGAFKFQADESATAIAGGLGAGFFLLAADAVFRAGRRGIEPGTVRVLAAAGSALLFAGLTGLSVPAARLDPTSVAIGAVAGALAGLAAARNPELGSSRVVVVALPAITAALASYAAAILMT